VAIPIWVRFVGEVPQSIRYLAIGRPPGGGAHCHVKEIWVAAGPLAKKLVGADGMGGVVTVTSEDGCESLLAESTAMT